jgi:hypothetical protein
VNQNYVQSFTIQAQENYQNVAEKVRVRLLQPASEFYNELMEAWILLKNQNVQGDVTPTHNSSPKKDSFKEYLSKVKSVQGSRWNDKYLGPTQFFFNALAHEWR